MESSSSLPFTPSWGMGRQPQISRVLCPEPFFLAGSSCSPSLRCLPQGLVARYFLVGPSSACLGGSTSAPAWWHWLAVCVMCALSNPISSSWCLLQWEVGRFFAKGWCCWWCQASRSGESFWGSYLWRSVLYRWWFYSSSKFLLHTARLTSHWSLIILILVFKDSSLEVHISFSWMKAALAFLILALTSTTVPSCWSMMLPR